MSTASTSRTIKFIAKAGTYTAFINSPSGDLYQHYEGEQGGSISCFPDYTESGAAYYRPVLYFVCMSSRATEGVAAPTSVRFYFNGTQITFGSDGVSTGTFAGYFKRVYPSDGQDYHGLQFLKNIVELSGYASATVKMVATIEFGSQTDEIQATYTIPISQSTSTSYRVTIAAGDTRNFVLTDTVKSCILKALAFQGGTELSGLSYQWDKMVSGAWQAITNATSQTLTVNAGDIDTYGEFLVHVFLGDGTEIGTDVQGVTDTADPYIIDANPTPEDETITEGAGTNQVILYKPQVVRRDSGEVVLTTQFYFTVRSAAGVILNGDDGNTPQTEYPVTYQHCEAAGSDVCLIITTAD